MLESILANHHFVGSILLLAPLLVVFAMMLSKLGTKIGVPSLLLFLIIGMCLGRDGLGFHFSDFDIAEHMGHFAMTIILLASGLGCKKSEMKPVLKDGLLLATAGTLITTLVCGLFLYLVFFRNSVIMGGSLLGSLLVAAILSPSDSTSAFSVIRAKRLKLRENLEPMAEVESVGNDPFAYIITTVFVVMLETSRLGGTGEILWAGIITFVLQLALGVGVGYGIGKLSTWLIDKVSFGSSGLMSIFILSLALCSNSIATFIGGNGLLATCVAAVIIGNKENWSGKKDVRKVIDGLSSLAQMLMFLMLGLLVRPSTLPKAILPAILLGLFMVAVARPASVFVSLSGQKDISTKGKALMSWMGIKGAGPILFAIAPVLAGLEGADDIFNIVFVITLLALAVNGTTLVPLARKLDLCYEDDTPVETFGLEIPEEMGMLRDHVVTEEDLTGGNTMRDMNLPHGVRVVMVKREGHFLVPHGSMPLMPGDRLVILIGDTDD